MRQLFVLVFLGTLSGCSVLCDNDLVKETLSPDGKWKAVVFQRDCGATTGFSTQLSVLKAAKNLPNRNGNVLIADTDHGKAPAAKWGGPDVQARWPSNNILQVSFHPATRIFKQEMKFAEVTVEYSSSQ